MVTSDVRQAVFDRDKKCMKCGRLVDLSIDHVLPLSRGGSDDFNNLQALCTTCNKRKGSFIEWGLFSRISIWLHCDELIERTRNEFKTIVGAIQASAARQENMVANMSSRLGQIKPADTAALQAKIETAHSLVHMQTSRITELETRLHLLEKHLKLEYYEGTTDIEHIIVETVPTRGFRKGK